MTSDMIGWVLREEGGVSDRPEDHGGPTNRGITIPALSDKLGRPATRADVLALTEADARAFYWWFAQRYKIDQLEQAAVRLAVLDASVNHGPANGARFLQRAVGVADDGLIGEKTLKAASWFAPNRNLAVLVCAERAEFYGRIITRNTTDADRDGKPDNMEMAEGWLARLARLMREVA